jgi:diaminohydroxyphosphoribosylaminopyrimidine deaminase/5-amino-6-(5-phosphoribosylamino)uracil reductase
MYKNKVNGDDDTHFMTHALRLAQRAQGRTAENPAVGCVLVKDGRVVGQGWTGAGGRPHAETQAIASAGEQARGATAYVTLEPCAHHGRTPPCSEALIQAGITHVVVACTDPDPRVAGRGIVQLREVGIAVTTGVLEGEATALNTGFFRRFSEGLPFITVKIATSADEKITSPTTRWLTSEAARTHGHLLRATHHAIVTGIGTVLADNPSLTCRLSGLEDASPARIILDRHARTPLTSTLVQTTPDVPTHLLTAHPHTNALRDAGVVVHTLPTDFSFTDAMRHLATLGFHRVLIEGGQHLTSAALDSGICNQLYWYKSPIIVGDTGLPALNEQRSLHALCAPYLHRTMYFSEENCCEAITLL